VRHLRRLTDSEIIAVVKADGYGHGAVRSANAALAGGAARLGVSDIDEALALRRAGIDAPIVAWLHAPGADFAEAAALGIELGISSLEQLQKAAAAASADRPVGVHLKLETGLSRNGIAPADYRIVFAEAARLERIGRVRVIALFSHLSNASVDDDRAALRRSRRPSPTPPRSAWHRRCGTSRRRMPPSTCPRRASGACASASGSTGSRRSTTARRPTSACAPR
jgi:alanine racemase